MVVATETTKKGDLRSILRIYNKFIRSKLDIYGLEPPTYIKFEMQTLESIQEQFEDMRKQIDFLNLLRGEDSIRQELSIFYMLYGRLCLVLILFTFTHQNHH